MFGCRQNVGCDFRATCTESVPGDVHCSCEKTGLKAATDFGELIKVDGSICVQPKCSAHAASVLIEGELLNEENSSIDLLKGEIGESSMLAVKFRTSIFGKDNAIVRLVPLLEQKSKTVQDNATSFEVTDTGKLTLSRAVAR